MSRAAEEPAPLATLILKTAVVEHEVADHKNEPVGNDIVTCLRKVIDSLQESHETHTEEGLTRVLHVLADLEQCILERLQELAGGTDEDAEVVRTGARAIEHDVKGDALKREYEQKRSALQDVERRVKQFFEADPH